MFTKAISIAVFALIAVLINTTLLVSAIPKISTLGAKFFTEDGDQFYIKGVAYQLISLDPLTDKDQCERDAKQMKDLGANAIRVYHVDPTADHTDCMSAFEDAGIYLFVDLDTFTTQISQDTPSWNDTSLSAFSAVLDEFIKYDNTAAVFVGNEVLTFGNQSDAAPYVKAAIRDVKGYRDSKGYRKIPVGYSAADIPELRPVLQNYLACGKKEAESADFFSLNVYEWCGESGYDQSGYAMLQKNASDYNIPLFVSETGCRVPKPRLFDDQAAILGDKMSDTWSGTIVYEWIAEENDYGLISYGPKVDPEKVTAALDGFPRSGTPTPVAPDYSNLKKHWATLSPSGVKSSDYTASKKPPACPTATVSGWMVDGDVPLPSLGQVLDRATEVSPTPKTTATGSAATASASGKGAATGGKEIASMGAGLVGVMLGFIVWL